jgi:8-amino-7-oxononanoate synthase
MEEFIKQRLKSREEEGLMRRLETLIRLPGGKCRVSGKEYIDLSSNDYLSFSFSEELNRAAYKVPFFGSCSSRLMTGSTAAHRRLETTTAHFKSKEDSLLFNSGYQANVGIISALCGKRDAVFSDRLVHASIIDGIGLSGCRHFRFRHNDMEHLEHLLSKNRSCVRNALIVTESVFSMDGDKAPLRDLVSLKKKYGSWLMIDEAHATGIFGPNGSGLAGEDGLSEEIEIIMGTYSKALAGFGAYAAVGKHTREYLLNFCRSFIYSTSLPLPVVEWNIAAVQKVSSERKRAFSLLQRSNELRDRLSEKGFSVRGDSQILPVLSTLKLPASAMSEKLKENGIWATPVRYPTVRKGEERIRLSLNYSHGREVTDRIVGVLGEII